MWPRFSSRRSSSGVPLYLNVYDLSPVNGYMYWFGLGIYHSAIEAYGVEYAFGAHDYPSSGVFEIEPHTCPGFKFRKSIFLGTIQLGPYEFRDFIKRVASEYKGDSYHLIVKNCNHFCDDICKRLTGSSIPGWVNRLAKLGSLCNCILPESLQSNIVKHTIVKHTTEYQACECETRGSRSIYSRLTATSPAVGPRKRQLSASSTFLQSSKEGFVMPWVWKNPKFFKESLRRSRS